MTTEKNELVPVTQQFAALRDTSAVTEAMAVNMGGGDRVSVFSFERIELPSKTSKKFIIQDEDLGEEETLSEILGVIVYRTDQRSFWLKSFDESGGKGGPPDCFSADTLTGYGRIEEDGPEERRDCATCPMAQFGSDLKGGPGQACKQTAALLILRDGAEDSVFPSLLVVSPGSLASLSKYMFRLTSKQIPYFKARHRLSLETAENAAGVKFPKIKFGIDRRLTEEEWTAIQQYAETLKDSLLAMQQDIVSRDSVE